jgi:hypothetical protein
MARLCTAHEQHCCIIGSYSLLSGSFNVVPQVQDCLSGLMCVEEGVGRHNTDTRGSPLSKEALQYPVKYRKAGRHCNEKIKLLLFDLAALMGRCESPAGIPRYKVDRNATARSVNIARVMLFWKSCKLRPG